MDPLVIIILAGLTVLAAVGAAYSRSSAPAILAPALATVSEVLGLDPPEPGTTVAEGFHDGAAVRIEGFLGSDDDPDYAQVRVTLARPVGLTAKSEGLLPSFDFKTGDALFDKKVKLAGDPPRLAGLLDSDVRPLLVEATGLRGFKAEGRLLACQVRDLRNQTGQVVAAVRLLAKLAGVLRAQPERTEKLLLNNVRRDPIPEVRRACAMFLGDRRFVGSDEHMALGQVLLADSDLELRLLGADQRPTDPRAQEVYLAACAAAEPEQRVRAVEGLRCSEHPQAVATLTGMLPDRAPTVTAAIAWALGELGGEAVEGVLLRMLGHRDMDVRVAAAEALGSQGTIPAVERLLAAGSGGRASQALRRATREAVAAIQQRCGVGEAGGLAIVGDGDAAGRLSEVEWGGLAVVEEE